MQTSKQVQVRAACAINDYLANVCSEAGIGQMQLCGTGAVSELEEKLKNYFGMRYALCVTNATIGLLAVALALELRNEEFVTSPITYGASLAGLLLLGNKPIFADVDPGTLTLSPQSAQNVITPKAKALLAVDIFGNPADTTSLRALAEQYGLWYIADAAQSFGARRSGRPASAFADAIVLSFTTGKSLFAGEGGAVLTNHESLFEKLVWYTQHPHRQHKDLSLQFNNEFGVNGRIHPLAAVWANATFEDTLQGIRKHQAKCFNLIEALNELGHTDEITFQKQDIEPAFFRLTAKWKDKPKRERLVRELTERSLPVSLEQLPVRLIYKQPAFLAQYKSNGAIRRCPEAERQMQKRVCIIPKRT